MQQFLFSFVLVLMLAQKESYQVTAEGFYQGKPFKSKCKLLRLHCCMDSVFISIKSKCYSFRKIGLSINF